MPNSLSNWNITFSQNPLLKTWSWLAKRNPDGATLGPMFLSITKAGAERDALDRIETFEARETIRGDRLRSRVVDQPRIEKHNRRVLGES